MDLSTVRAIVCFDRQLDREVVSHLLTHAGIEVVGSVPDPMTLLTSVQRLRPDVVFLMTADPSKTPGICSHLLGEYPTLKIVILSSEQFTIADCRIRLEQYADLSIDAIRDSLRTLPGTTELQS